jgi:hypothetical protein
LGERCGLLLLDRDLLLRALGRVVQPEIFVQQPAAHGQQQRRCRLQGPRAMRNGIRERSRGCVVHGCEKASCEFHLFTPAGSREIRRFETRSRARVQCVAHIGVDEIVFNPLQPRREHIVGDARLVEALGGILWQKPQHVLDELVVVRRFTRETHVPP